MNDRPHPAQRPDTTADDDLPIGNVLTRREVLTLVGGVGAAAFVAGCAPAAVASPAASLLASRSNAPTIAPTNGPASAASTPTGTTAAALPSCIVRPAQTEGPYYVDEQLQRSDIRPDPSDGSVQEGIPLTLTFLVAQVGAADCTALSGAVVDVWHCNALGVYSDVRGPSLDTTGKMFLRGSQVTDATGTARFTTVYPGWYQGRTVHIHFRIRTEPAGASGTGFTLAALLRRRALR